MIAQYSVDDRGASYNRARSGIKMLPGGNLPGRQDRYLRRVLRTYRNDGLSLGKLTGI
jgi:hypothetical protein